MKFDKDLIPRLLETNDLEQLKELMNWVNHEIRGGFEHQLHHAFQVKPWIAGMSTPPVPEQMDILCSSDLIQPMFKGIYTQNTDLIRQTLQADPPALERRDASAYTPFLRAAETCKVELIELLAQEGADVFAVRKDDFGGGALHVASWNETNPDEQVAAMTRLIELGCNVNALTKDDATPLMLAALSGKNWSVECLIQHGADPGLKSREGKTALEYAMERDHSPTIRLLKHFESC